METTTFERAVHLALFVVGGIAFAVAALASLERLTGAERRVIRPAHVAAAAGAFAALVIVEAAFHVTR